MNTPLIKIFEEIAVMLELKGENQFRIKSFLIAARTLEELDLSNEQLIENLTSEKVKGFGPQLTELALEFLNTGQISLYLELKSEFPSGLLDLLAISGLGPKKLKILYLELGVSSIDKLEEICQNGTLESVKGFGKKTVRSFLEKIQEIRTYHGHIRLPEALQIVQITSSLVQEVDPSAIVETTGQIRRFLEIISQIHFLVCSPKRTEILESLEKHFGKCTSAADNSYTFIEKHNCEVILEFTSPNFLASCLFLTTGNSKHLDELKKTDRRKVI